MSVNIRRYAKTALDKTNDKPKAAIDWLCRETTMKKYAIAAMLLTTAAHADPLQLRDVRVCKVPYALCAASPATPVPGKTITVLGKVFPIGIAVCPVISSAPAAIGNVAIQKDGCTPKNKKQIYSMFGTPEGGYPQPPSWNTAPAVIRAFKYDPTSPTTSESNGWGMTCDIQAKTINGVTLANCYVPLNESPWTNSNIQNTRKTWVGTQSVAGSAYPIGGPVPEGLVGK